MTEPSDPARQDLDVFWARLVACHHDLPALLDVIANRVVDLLGDGCVLTLLGPDGRSLQPQAVVHRDPFVQAAMRLVLTAEEVQIGEGIAGAVAADRRPVLLNDLPPETIAETTPAQFLPFVRDHPIRALMVAPLVASGELVGTLGAVRTTSGEPYAVTDLRHLEALADRAALAVHEAVSGPRTVGPADFEALYRHNLDAVLITTPDGHILSANPMACSILGRTEREIIEGGRDAVVLAEDPRLARGLTERAASGQARGELSMRRGDGTVFTADASSVVFTTPDRRMRALVMFRDVSEQVAARDLTKARVAELEQAADRDPLTGLWNRRGFSVASEQALATADRQGLVSQLIFVDVDGLKAINDARGHTLGDATIVAVAAAIEQTIREGDVAGRFGGDEFVVLVLDTPSSEVPSIVQRITKELAVDSDAPPGITFSTGVIERPPGMHADLSDLIDAADRDMYQQKMLNRLRRSH